eukprot:COSAG06_NODE_23682_length_684_cov_1.087179_1_plen_179_part_10
MFAEENSSLHVSLVATFHQAMVAAPANELLPKWYLMDSICKNVGGAFVTEFSKWVVPLFCDTFEKRPDLRERLAKLLRLWQQTGIFSSDHLKQMAAHAKATQFSASLLGDEPAERGAGGQRAAILPPEEQQRQMRLAALQRDQNRAAPIREATQTAKESSSRRPPPGPRSAGGDSVLAQ